MRRSSATLVPKQAASPPDFLANHAGGSPYPACGADAELLNDATGDTHLYCLSGALRSADCTRDVGLLQTSVRHGLQFACGDSDRSPRGRWIILRGCTPTRVTHVNALLTLPTLRLEKHRQQL